MASPSVLLTRMPVRRKRRWRIDGHHRVLPRTRNRPVGRMGTNSFTWTIPERLQRQYNKGQARERAPHKRKRWGCAKCPVRETTTMTPQQRELIEAAARKARGLYQRGSYSEARDIADLLELALNGTERPSAPPAGPAEHGFFVETQWSSSSETDSRAAS